MTESIKSTKPIETNKPTKTSKIFTRILSHVLIAITVGITGAFAFGLASGLIGVIYLISAVALEAVKYFCIHELATSGNYWKNAILGALTAALISFSGFASWNFLHQSAVTINNQNQQVQMKYENEQMKYTTNMKIFNELSENISVLQKSINSQSSRSDRNTITDARIQNDRNELQKIKEERDSIEIKKPVKIQTTDIPEFVAIFISMLIEISSVLVNFFVYRKPKESEKSGESNQDITEKVIEQAIEQTRSKVEQTKQTVQTEKVVEQAIEQTKSKAEQTKKSISKILNLTNAQRIRLSRNLKSRGIDWKTFNTDLNNLEEAKSIAKITSS